MSNIPSYDDELESSPESTPRSLPSADENDDSMYDFYRPALTRRNAIPVLTRRNATIERNDSTSSDSTATTISNNSIKHYTSSDSDDLDLDALFSRNKSNDEVEQKQPKNPWAYESDSEGGKSRRKRRRHRTIKRRKTNRRHRTIKRRRTHRRRKTHRRR